jgi:hypothetical protein
LSLYNLYKCRQHGLETRYILGSLTLAFVGFGSFLFHMSLLWVSILFLRVKLPFFEGDDEQTESSI